MQQIQDLLNWKQIIEQEHRWMRETAVPSIKITLTGNFTVRTAKHGRREGYEAIIL